MSKKGSSKDKGSKGSSHLTTISRKNIREDRKNASLWNFSKGAGDTLKKEMVLYIKSYFDTLRWNPNRIIVLDCEKGVQNFGIKLPVTINTSTRNTGKPSLRLSFASPSVLSAFVSCLEVYIMTHMYNQSQYLPIRLILNDLHLNDLTAPLLMTPKISLFLMQLDLSYNCLGPMFIASLANQLEIQGKPHGMKSGLRRLLYFHDYGLLGSIYTPPVHPLVLSNTNTHHLICPRYTVTPSILPLLTTTLHCCSFALLESVESQGQPHQWCVC